ncbi:MAG TPA: phytanoyl-CoA dioxygenase family protein [Armatimonadota bacterium]|nr:phytanoyl-CoA dioxygenase family protein [Armatimonadota bacterium]
MAGPGPILTPRDHVFFEEQGYVVIPNAVRQENLDAVIDLIWEFLGMDRNCPEDWYREPHRPGGMVEVYQHQALWDNRQHPRVYQAFSEILGTERLWVSTDRANMKPPQHPAHPEYDHRAFIHWDVDTSKLPQPFAVQGVLYLADTDAGQGGFQCVPGMHRNLEEWVKTQPADRDPSKPDLTGRTVTAVPGKAGDLLIWNRLLPHGNGHNLSKRPRLAQYITMYREQYARPDLREDRIRRWRERLPPSGSAFPGDQRGWEQSHGQPAELTPLGRKLLGLEPWPDDTV